jgi:predicted DsbA family dithiol-disulfide isomerase
LLSNSRYAVEAAESARDKGKHSEFHRAVLAAYFADGKDIGDVEVLAALAERSGLDPGLLREELSASAYAGRRRAAEIEAHDLGVSAVPAFLFADGTRVVGAQPLDYFRGLLERMTAGRR